MTIMPAPRSWRANSKRPIQIGENFSLPVGMQRRARCQRAADYVMPDLERIGGVTGWRQAAEIAAAHKLQMSSHLFPGSQRASARRHADLPLSSNMSIGPMCCLKSRW